MTTEQAMKRWHENYDNDLYLAAVEGKSVEYANQLIDTSMAYCNHPSYQIASVKTYWNETSTEFLVNFRFPQFNHIPKFKRIANGFCPDCDGFLSDNGNCLDCHITPALDPDYQKWLKTACKWAAKGG